MTLKYKFLFQVLPEVGQIGPRGPHAVQNASNIGGEHVQTRNLDKAASTARAWTCKAEIAHMDSVKVNNKTN